VPCEKYLYDNLYRGGDVALDRPLVAGDASALPFKTDTFDILISSHLLGHLEDPRSFFQESARVTRSGFFFAPSSLLEQLRSIPTHLWLVQQ
jgi:ubiquinone/menaquinone biosynthesis C-methylase UbiE